MICNNEHCKPSINMGMISIHAKTSDMCAAKYEAFDGDTWDNHGYTPSDIGIGGGDYLKFSFCPYCGTLANFKPLEIEDVIEAIEGM